MYSVYCEKWETPSKVYLGSTRRRNSTVSVGVISGYHFVASSVTSANSGWVPKRTNAWRQVVFIFFGLSSFSILSFSSSRACVTTVYFVWVATGNNQRTYIAYLNGGYFRLLSPNPRGSLLSCKCQRRHFSLFHQIIVLLYMQLHIWTIKAINTNHWLLVRYHCCMSTQFSGSWVSWEQSY